MKQPLFLLSLLALASLSATAQTKPDTIPFTLNKQHNICVKASVNQTEGLILMLHSSASGLTMTQEGMKKLPVKSSDSVDVRTWGGSAVGEFIEGNTLSINKLHWDSLTMFINELSGEGTDGKFGFDFFEDKVLEIDYDHQRLVVHPSMPKLAKGYKKVPLFSRRGSFLIPGELKLGRQVYRDTFMFHTGYGGSILLDPKIGERYGMQSSLKTISTSELKDAYGNVFKIETKELPKVKVGGRQLKGVPLSFAARSSDIPMKVFGNGLLRRFNVVFDFREGVVYMRPNWV